jgi:hypothetical protein
MSAGRCENIVQPDDDDDNNNNNNNNFYKNISQEDNITVKWAQEDVKTLYSLLNNNNNNNNFYKNISQYIQISGRK